MRLPIIICLLLMNCLLQAQNTVVQLSLPIQENKKKAIPFYFKEVTFSPDVSDTIGIIAVNKNKGIILASLQKNKSALVLDFLHNQFEENKKGTAIQLQITKLKVAPMEAGTFTHKDTFQFQCKFYAYAENEKVALYSFNAKNPFGTFNDADKVMANYVTRALISSVEKFKDSFEKNRDWLKSGSEENNSEKKLIKIYPILNKISSPDSIACTYERKLNWNDFQENPNINKASNKDSAGLGSAKFILTYRAHGEETNNYLKLDIAVNAFFYKRNSWSPKDRQDNGWLAYQQGHFDLCAIYGMKLYNNMKNHSFSLGTYKTELNTIFNEINSEFISLRKQYQSETEEGKQTKQMLVWRKKIESLRKNN